MTDSRTGQKMSMLNVEHLVENKKMLKTDKETSKQTNKITYLDGVSQSSPGDN